MHTLEFYFDCSSPWTYLAFESMQPFLESPQVDVQWKPFLVGGVFNSINPSVYQNREKPLPVKQAYYKKDLQDWSAYVGVPIGSPPVFPVNSVKVMRGAFVAMEHDVLVAYARLAFQRYWGELKDISQDDEVTKIAEEVGLNGTEFWQKITSQAYKDRLKDNTDNLMERGGFGSPTFFLNGADMYFGNDRLGLIQRKIFEG